MDAHADSNQLQPSGNTVFIVRSERALDGDGGPASRRGAVAPLKRDEVSSPINGSPGDAERAITRSDYLSRAGGHPKADSDHIET
jgi:hypothetical protein